MIAGGPLIDLKAIQSAISNGAISPDSVWIATEKAEDDLEKLQWNEDRICDLIAALSSSDYHQSEWCTSSSNSKHPCDAYVIRFDDEENVRDWRAPEYYIKFSLTPYGLTVCVVSCHLCDS